MHPITDIIRVQEAPLPAALPAPAYQEKLQDLWEKRKAKNTRRAYASDWRQFEIWSFGAGHESMPAAPQTIAVYLAHLTTSRTATGKEYSSSTIARRLASISHFHRDRGAADPTKDPVIVGLMEGIRRDLAGRPTAAKAAVLTKHLRKGLRTEPVKPADFRNRALLLIGFAGAFRRSELVGIDVEHLQFDEEGGHVRISLPKSKTNQDGKEEHVFVLAAGAHCPVRALRAWLQVAGITSGAVFRSIDRHKNVRGRISEDLVPYIVKRFAKAAGLDPAQFSGHSLRSGHVTQSLLNDVPLPTIQQQTRHRDINTLIAYNRNVEPLKHNSSGHLGL